MAKRRVVLIDGSALIFRAFFALPADLRTAAGQQTNAAYGFAQMFKRLLDGKQPAWGAVVFDAPGKKFRAVHYQQYKANRGAMPEELVGQLALIDRIVEAHDFPMLRVPDVEADDVIGTLTRLAVEAGHEVHIISGDKDFAQLIGNDVRMDDPIREVVYDADLVFKRWAVRPDQFVDWLALVGDRSDNIPGVAGIGRKGASNLLAEHGSLNAMLADPTKLKGRPGKLLVEHKDDALLSRKLATIVTDVPLQMGLADLVIPEPNRERIDALYRELEFFSLLGAPAQPDQLYDPSEVDYGVAVTDREVTALLGALDPDEPVGLLVLHDLPRALVGDLSGVAIAIEPGVVRFIPFPGRLTRVGGSALKTWLEDPNMPKLTHTARDAWVVLARHGIQLAGVVGDTALASYLVDPTQAMPHSLDVVVREYLHRAIDSFKRLVGRGKKRKSLAQADPADVAEFACHLADAILQLWQVLGPKVEESQQAGFLAEVDLPMSELLGLMELTGIAVDTDVLNKLGDALKMEGAVVEERIFELAGHPFNVGSLKQLSAVLFDELKLPVLKRTKTGYSTASDVLKRLSPKHEIIAHVLRWRSIAKLINTYTDVLVAAVDQTTGRIHCTFQQTVSASGRLITTDPDLQRTPVRTAEGRTIRQAFVAGPGNVLLSADWSQIELRLLAHMTGDELLVEAFALGLDIHARTAAQIHGIGLDEVTKEQRNIGKTVNFATIYGQGATALGQQLGLPRAEAAELIRNYFERYCGVAAWKSATIAQASHDGFVTTLLGRRRIVRELSSRNQTDRSYGERIAVNTPIQGSASDLCKLAMLQIAAALPANGLHGQMVLQIHDELLFEVPESEASVTAQVVKLCMEGCYPLRVPLVVDVGVGRSWAEAH